MGGGAGAADFWGGEETSNNTEAWDVDGDGALSEDEFSSGVYSQYDQDGTGMIEESELTDIGDDGFWDV
jgi:Ca2+-binding EF-hand superfamily protein